MLGRNEMISHYIEEKTGETRTRKQIGSHIHIWITLMISDVRKKRNNRKIDQEENGREEDEQAGIIL